MLKPAVTVALLVPVFASSAYADTQTVTVDTLVVVTPNPPVVVTQGAVLGGPQSVAPVLQPPGAAEIPPAPQMPSNGAPQNEPWSNVSHINGTPIKVGERGDYLYKFKKTNIMANPFGFFFGYYDFSASHALNQNLALSVAVTAWSDDYESGYQLAATAPLYFRRAYSGPFLEGGLLVRHDSEEDYYYDSSYSCIDDCSSSSSWAGPELMFGWHWSFDSGLNIAGAFGVAKRMNDDDEYDSGAEPVGYFRVGYAF
jgi:hypothetical protein